MQTPRIEINGSACALGYLVHASCTDCQRICPTDAIDLSTRAPAIDTSACTLCGACVGVCPEAVFSMPTPIPPAQGVEHPIACQCHPAITDPAALRCIHSIGLGDLAQMWLNGMRRLLVATDSCAACDAAPYTWLETTVADFNRLAACRNLEGIELASATRHQIAHWQKAQDLPNPSRRSFLRKIVAAKPEKSDQTAAEALLKFLSQGHQPVSAETLYPFTPQIDHAACIACDDCVNICPHEALTLIKAKNTKALYACTPERCTGCKLCSDVCDVNAVEVLSMETKGTDVMLNHYQCRACGVDSHNTDAPPADGLCRICQQTGHHKKLFVVLD